MRSIDRAGGFIHHTPYIMDVIPLNRAYLETLSTADLVDLADEYGIDIPEGLNRRFIIGELLELADDNRKTAIDSALRVSAEFDDLPEILPETYNETRISALLRDPGWVFAFWDFHTIQYSAVTSNHRFESFFIRVNSLSSSVPATVTDFFDVNVGVHDRKWYVHLSNRNFACRIDLYARISQEKDLFLARSSAIHVPSGSSGEVLYDPLRENPLLLELSGIGDLQKDHFRNHRQSFN
jgi:hypothetical protein